MSRAWRCSACRSVIGDSAEVIPGPDGMLCEDCAAMWGN